MHSQTLRDPVAHLRSQVRRADWVSKQVLCSFQPHLISSKNPRTSTRVRVDKICSPLLLPTAGFVKLTTFVLILCWHVLTTVAVPCVANHPPTPRFCLLIFPAVPGGLHLTMCGSQHEGIRKKAPGGNPEGRQSLDHWLRLSHVVTVTGPKTPKTLHSLVSF
jgi:hypothetical protein